MQCVFIVQRQNVSRPSIRGRINQPTAVKQVQQTQQVPPQQQQASSRAPQQQNQSTTEPQKFSCLSMFKFCCILYFLPCTLNSKIALYSCSS